MISVETEDGEEKARGKWGFSKRNKKIKNPDGFVRKGQFKKASNMNYCLDFSIRVEDEFLRLMAAKAQEKGCEVEELTKEDENELNEEAMKTIIESDEGRTLAQGNVRIGEIILLIDSDTRVVSLKLQSCSTKLILLDSPKTVSSTVLWKCTKALKLPSCSMPQASCKLRTTPSKTESPTSRTSSTCRFNSLSVTEIARHSLATMPSYAGKPSKLSPSKRTACGSSGLIITCLKISTSVCECR